MFLTDLYTAMTRARTASVFIDNGLSRIIGKNVFSNNKSKAPSILEGVKELREKKLAILDKFQLDLGEAKTNSPAPTTTTPEPSTSSTTSAIDPYSVLNIKRSKTNPKLVLFNSNIDDDSAKIEYVKK
jgi:hypothetical protein